MTEARRKVTLEVLRYAPGSTIQQILALLSVREDWPESDWGSAQNKPYYGGTLQHLHQMESEDPPRVRYEVGDDAKTHWWTTDVRQRPRSDVALVMHDEGKSLKEIATALDCSVSWANVLVNDPTYEKERARKARYCTGCGAPRPDPTVRCQPCVERKANDLLPEPDELTDVAHLIARASVRGIEVLIAVRDDLQRVIRQGTSRGWVEYELYRGETWAHAIKSQLELEDAA